MALVRVDDYRYPQGWVNADGGERARYYCQQLEEGKVVFFPEVPYDLPEADREFLLSQKQSAFKGHKNVSYRPQQDLLRGAAEDDPEQARRLHDIMRRFSDQIVGLLSKVLAPYASHWSLDFATFRPLEEQGRDLPLHKRNDLAHVDAFPSRPTNGARILRCFTNINPSQSRIWETAEPFDVVAGKLAIDAGLSKYARRASSPARALRRGVAPLLKAVGLPDRSPYDQFMLHFHDYLKENDEFQTDRTKWKKNRLEFPPYSTWLVFTDSVPHAALSGQYAIEQTFIVPVGAMVAPQHSPIRVLESMCGTALSN